MKAGEAEGDNSPASIAMGSRRSMVTSYPPELIQATIAAVGAEHVVDEISRDEDPSYTHAYLSLDIPAYIPLEGLAHSRILDFGCGGGASTLVLHRLVSDAEIVGVELDETYLALAEPRRRFYGIENIRFLKSPGPKSLPPDIGMFDLVMMSAVFEHVLPDERDSVLDMLWSVLRPGGVMIVDQTPHRWFPQESHTTALPFLNYLPRPLAHRAARWSPRIMNEATWEELLRWGVRGATKRELVQRLERLGYEAEALEPTGLGVRDEVELWYRGPSYAGYGAIKPAWNLVARGIQRAFGIALVPYLSVALRKTSSSPARPDRGALIDRDCGADTGGMGTQTQRLRDERGFTLIEILVVIIVDRDPDGDRAADLPAPIREGRRRLREVQRALAGQRGRGLLYRHHHLRGLRLGRGARRHGPAVRDGARRGESWSPASTNNFQVRAISKHSSTSPGPAQAGRSPRTCSPVSRGDCSATGDW